MSKTLTLLFVLILFLGIGAEYTTAQAEPDTENPSLGFALITSKHTWEQQRQIIRTSGTDFVRLPVSPEFGNNPSLIDDLVSDGVTSIAIQSRGCGPEFAANTVHADLFGGGYDEKVREYPDIQFYFEVGNEPDIFCSGIDTPTTYRNRLLSVVKHLRTQIQEPNLSMAAGLAYSPDFNRELLADGRVLEAFDSVAYHIYAHAEFGDDRSSYQYLQNELSKLNEPIILTEVGINGNIGEELKASRYRDFAQSLPPTVEGVAFWTLDPDYASNYTITTQMATVVLGVEQAAVHCFSETGHCISGEFRTFWETNGLDFGDPGVSYRESLLFHGFPLTDPFVHPRTGYLTQVFERSVMELHPNNPDPYRVLMVHLGRLYLLVEGLTHLSNPLENR